MGDDFKLVLLAVTAGALYFTWKMYSKSEGSLNPIENNPGTFQGSVQPGQRFYSRNPLDVRQDQGNQANQPWAAEIFNNLPVLASDRPGDNNYSSVQGLWDSLNVPSGTGKNLDYFRGGVGN